MTAETSAAPDACARFVRALCDELGSASGGCQLAEQRVHRFTPARCERGLGALVEEVAALRRYQETVAALASPGQLLGGKPAPASGPLDAPVTMVLFSDFDSSACARASPLARAVGALHGRDVRLIFRQLPDARHPWSRLAAEASLEAHAQGKFWAFHDVLFGNSHDHSRPALERYGRQVGLDVPKLAAALDGRLHAAEVDEDVALARSAFVTLAPALFIGGRLAEVPYGTAELEELLADRAPE